MVALQQMLLSFSGMAMAMVTISLRPAAVVFIVG
jgi:hypothetical protein